jgi:glycine betaine/proline transport system substrate-binding protein
MNRKNARTAGWLLVGALAAVAAGCGSDKKTSSTTAAPATTVAAAATTAEPATTAAAAATTAEAAATTAEAAATTEAAAETTTGETSAESPTTTGEPGAPIVLAVNPWTGSAVNANVAKVVLESKLNTSVTLQDIDENATWPGMDAGDIDAVLEVWPSGHAADISTYIDDKKSVVDIGLLGPDAKIGWYIPTALLTDHPELATWEGFKDKDNAKLFATAESGDDGQFLMGDPSYVSYDEQIIANLDLPLKFVVAGSEAALITAIKQSVADGTPLLMQFWQPHWLQSQVDLTEVKLPDVTDECLASAAANDGKYACDYPVDHLLKAASAKLEEKNPAAFNFLSKMQLTTEQQNEIAANIDGDAGMSPADAAQAWVDANADIVDSWLS